MFDLHDIPDPDLLLPGIAVAWWGWLLLGILLTGTACALIHFLPRHPAAVPRSDACFRDSCEALETFRPLLAKLTLAEVATETSFVLRHYLVLTLREPALYQTHEEFLLRSDALQKLPGGAKDRLAPLLSELASAKYGPSRIDPSTSERMIDDSLRVLQGLESTRERHIA